jgi:hypothetical protein
VAIPLVAVGDKATAAWANAVANFINNLYLGDNTVAGPVTLATTALVAGGSSVTVTLAQQTRVRIYTQAMFTMLTATNGRYIIRSLYNTGAAVNVATAIQVQNPGAILIPPLLAGSQGACSASTEGTVLLAAGQYTFSPGVQRASGGGATDTAANAYVSVQAIGFT